ncbi:hypothetical protein LTR53_002049 [Teratosphaeriaceae sp. CCFEE 6253]|nr:hypothetical protein LTR53_002049 [Teratosphaeriaceae sp. CCFEE 6253]
MDCWSAGIVRHFAVEAAHHESGQRTVGVALILSVQLAGEPTSSTSPRTSTKSAIPRPVLRRTKASRHLYKAEGVKRPAHSFTQPGRIMVSSQISADAASLVPLPLFSGRTSNGPGFRSISIDEPKLAAISDNPPNDDGLPSLSRRDKASIPGHPRQPEGTKPIRTAARSHEPRQGPAIAVSRPPIPGRAVSSLAECQSTTGKATARAQMLPPTATRLAAEVSRHDAALSSSGDDSHSVDDTASSNPAVPTYLCDVHGNYDVRLQMMLPTMHGFPCVHRLRRSCGSDLYGGDRGSRSGPDAANSCSDGGDMAAGHRLVMLHTLHGFPYDVRAPLESGGLEQSFRITCSQAARLLFYKAMPWKYGVKEIKVGARY